MANEQHAQALTQATAIFEAYRAAYTIHTQTLTLSLRDLYDTFITPIGQKVDNGEWTDFRRGWARRALAAPSRAIDAALAAHLRAESSRELAELQGRPAPQQKKTFEAYTSNVERLVSLATKAAYARLKRREPPKQPSDADASEDTVDSSISRSPSPLPAGSKRARPASPTSEHSHSHKRDRTGSSPPPPATEPEADADASPSRPAWSAAGGESPDFGGSDFGYESAAADDAFSQEADAAPSPGRCAAGGGSPDFGYENGDADADDASQQEADAAGQERAAGAVAGAFAGGGCDAPEEEKEEGDGDLSTTPKSKPKKRVAKPPMAGSPSAPSHSRARARARARSRSPSEYVAELQAAQTAYAAAEAKYRACPTSTTCEQRTLAGRREELCGTDAFAAAESFLANPGSLGDVWRRVKAEVPARAARLAIDHAVRELGAAEPTRAKGFLIEALFRHLLYGRQDLLEEWNFLEKAADADAAWRAGGLQSQVAALLVGTGGMSELLACAAPTDVLQYVCLEGSVRVADILAGSVSASLSWKECQVSDHARVFGHAVTDPARSYDIAYTVSQGHHLKSVVSLRAGTPLTWYGVTARHGRQNTPPQSNMTPTRRGDLTHQHIAWGSGGVSLDGRYCKPTDALAGGGAFANNPPPGTAASLASSLYAVRRGGASQIVPVLVMATKVDVKARDELTYQYTACFDAEPTLLAMRSCADLPQYLSLMPHLDPGALFGSYANFWQHLLAYEGRKRQLAEAKDARDKAKEHLEALRAAAEE